MPTRTETSPLLEFRNVERTFSREKNAWTFGPLSLHIQNREKVAIVGPSGSGKSTLLHLAAGFLERTSGQILFQNQDISKMQSKEICQYRNSEMGFVFQDFYLFSEFSLLENIAMPLFISGESASARKTKAEGALRDVGLSHKSTNKPQELSGGERQRGAIARAIIHHPKILFADEPTGNLDGKTGELILKLLHRLSEEYQMTLLIVTHDEKIANFTDSVIHLENGKMVRDENS
ncbi:ABC transporter ATP-binding protein [Candidatus Peregrinibacteria bacterium]|nr:ABC transporter ATP-binding protein [Candidatus Peregrinibacteria bacterium]